MTYDEAVKKVRAEKAKDNYLIVHIDARLVLPHKDGMLLMQALAQAERLPRYYSDPKNIQPLDESTITTSVLAAKEYELYKIAALLNISYEELKKQFEAKPESE